MIYINKIENRITFKIKTGYYLEHLTPESLKLLGSTGIKISKNVPHLEITEEVLINCDIVNNGYQQEARLFFTFVPNTRFLFYKKNFYQKMSFKTPKTLRKC